jgi:hypothetical protein
VLDLYKQSCWIIIDCWEQQPSEDLSIVPNINELNYQVANNIYNTITNLNIKHCLVSCNASVMPQFSNLLNVHRSQSMLLEYMQMFRLKSLIYTGFHDGLCILHKKYTGAKYMSKHVNCFLKQDLVCRIPELFKKTDVFPPKQTIAYFNKQYFKGII